MQIGIVNLKAQYQQIKDELEDKLLKILAGGHYILGPAVADFEQEIAKYLGVPYAVSVNSGTTAIQLALATIDLKPGDEVITSPFTFIATAEAISYFQGKPVFVDVDAESYCLDVGQVEARISSKTKAIIPVHLYGQAVDMDPLRELARKYNLMLIEDACQAIGTEYKGLKAGALGDFGCFSFFPTKNMGAAGEGGLITCKEEAHYQKILALRNHGSFIRYEHEFIGFNARLDTIQCAILSVKLRYLDQWNQKRVANANYFNKNFVDLPCFTPKIKPYSNHVYHQYVLRLKNRDLVLEKLSSKGIACAVHYPKPIHLQVAYSYLGHQPSDFPVSERLSREVISLPIYPELSDSELGYIVDSLKEVLREQ